MPNPIKPTIKTEIAPLAIIAASLIASFFFYAHFPERVPVHWNAAGQVDRLGSRFEAAFLIPLMIAGMYLLFMAIPYLDPKKDRYDQFRKVYHIFKNLIILSLAIIYFAASLSGLGYGVKIDVVVPALIGLLFIVIGNYMGKIKPNWFMGIRTPWTLSSETVWNKTHRLGGKMFMAGGALLMLTFAVPIPARLPVLIAIVMAISILPMAYSYILYREESKKAKKNP